MNIVLMVMDSLRHCSIKPSNPLRPRTPFLDQLKRETLSFNAAFATECWTLPTHISMFTGQMPSEHGAHFAHMAYTHKAPTLAETLSERGYHTEIITRNSIFDGGVPGVNRGFAKNTLVQAEQKGFNPGAWLLALSKGRIRRQLAETGFISAAQRQNLRFAKDFVRSMFPADHLACQYTLEQMARLQKSKKPYFLFCNLYDVHAPYPPMDDSIFLPANKFSNIVDNLNALAGLAKISSHAYLQQGFSLPEAYRQTLLTRYHHAIARMDNTVAQFYTEAHAAGLLDDTLFILTADHGEAFGEHAVYLHDAALYDENISVPLWIRHPHYTPTEIDDVISTRELFQVMRHAAGLTNAADTILDADYRRCHPNAFVEHFYYPHVKNIAPYYAQNITAVVTQNHKVIARREGMELYDRLRDPSEINPLAPRKNEIAEIFGSIGTTK